LNRMISPSAVRQPVRKEAAPVRQSFFSRPVEEQCLSLMLQHPELRKIEAGVLPEYFENSENREIYLAWKQAEDPETIKDSLDSALLEHMDTLMKKSVLATQIEERYNRYVLRLREEYLKGMARKRASLTGTDSTTGELPGEQELEVSTELRDVFTQKARRGKEQRRKDGY
jgi:hypothetical protein